MAKQWVKVKEVSCDDAEGVYRVRTSGNKLVIEKAVEEWEDITCQCTAQLSPRKDGGGLYVVVKHGGDVVAVMGMSPAMIKPRYKLEKVPGATYSFRVFRRSC